MLHEASDWMESNVGRCVFVCLSLHLQIYFEYRLVYGGSIICPNGGDSVGCISVLNSCLFRWFLLFTFVGHFSLPRHTCTRKQKKYRLMVTKNTIIPTVICNVHVPQSGPQQQAEAGFALTETRVHGLCLTV